MSERRTGSVRSGRRRGKALAMGCDSAIARKPGSPAGDLGDILTEAILAHDAVDADRQIALAGPAIGCGERAAEGLLPMLGELLTNASKYGALSSRHGRVTLLWWIDRADLIFHWLEIGGPRVTRPTGLSGLGNHLIDRVATVQFGGKSIDSGKRMGWRFDCDFHWTGSLPEISAHAHSFELPLPADTAPRPFFPVCG